mmetsp:Transcript_925/g.2153  ORF Transcript_925/g.2153 Transcript_925/m.2153 type:complete len:169 (+) Transcript_925:138-644(+)
MPGFLIQQPQTDTNPHRWCPINALKNSPVTIVLHCSWSGERYPLPATATAAFNDDDANYFDEASPTSADLIGSTSLYDVIKMVKAQIPTLYMWEEVGGLVLTCGTDQVFASEWETTMLCNLISNTDAVKEVLSDGREAIVVTIGDAASMKNGKASVVTRCLAKGDVYG